MWCGVGGKACDRSKSTPQLCHEQSDVSRVHCKLRMKSFENGKEMVWGLAVPVSVDRLLQHVYPLLRFLPGTIRELTAAG